MQINKVNGILTGLALLSFVPFLVLAFYWHPVGTHAFDWISNWGGRFDYTTWLAQQKEWYTTTMGRYTSTGLLSTTAHWYTLERARVVIVLFLLALPLSLSFLLKGLLKLSYGSAIGISFLIIALWLGQLANPYDTLYRWSGLFTYHLGLILTLLYAGALVRKQFLLATFLVAMAVGTNEISLVQCGMLTGAWCLIGRGEWGKPASILLISVALICAAIALSAPGNFDRSALYSDAGSYSKAAFLTVASSVYLWLGWLGSGALILFSTFFWLADLPVAKLSRTKFYLAIVSLVLVVPLSIAPVLMATKGDSLPEGITDWQILPVLLLSLLIVSQLPKPVFSKGLYFFLGVAMLLPPLFGGLGIDRSRETSERSAISRIMVSGKAGNAWLQLLSGTSAAYDRAVAKQYEAAAAGGPDTLIYVAELPDLPDNYLYDRIYDRRSRRGGERFFGYVVGKNNITVKYTKN